MSGQEKGGRRRTRKGVPVLGEGATRGGEGVRVGWRKGGGDDVGWPAH